MVLKLKPHFETEVYVTEGGYVAIKQPDDRDPQESQTVLLAAEQLPDIVEELKSLYEDRRSWAYPTADESDDHDAKPPA